MRTALFWVIAQRAVVIPYRRFGTTYRSHLQGSRILDFYGCFGTTYRSHLQVVPMNMGPIGCPETSVRNYLCSLRNSPEERSSQKAVLATFAFGE